jgi:hypothetical protein
LFDARANTLPFASVKFYVVLAYKHDYRCLTMKTAVSAAVLGLAAVANAKTLTPDNWDAEVAGKTVFIKFQAPW